jgi:phospholipid/cholesterol/gamma-HCH transport system substrate-binding protein
VRVDNLRWKIAGLVGFVAICGFLFLYLFQQAGGRLRLSAPYTVKALVPEPLNVVDNSDVRERGIKIGRVRKIESVNGLSQITFEIEKKAETPLYRDATVRVRTKTLVGESYLDVDRGSRTQGALADGATIPLSSAKETVALERILSTLDPATRREVRRNLAGLGAGLDGRGKALNRVFAAIPQTVADGGRLVRVLEPQREQVARLIDNTGQVLQALGERKAAFRGLVTDAKATADAVVTRDQQLVDSIQELPATLRQARSSVNHLSDFSGRATPVFRDLRISATQLSPAIRDLGPAARDARTLFRELRPFLNAVNPLVTELRPASTKLKQVIRPLDATLRQALPAVSYLEPFSKEFGTFFANVGSTIGAKDALGSKARVYAIGGEDQFTGLTAEQRKLLNAFIDAGGLGLIHGVRSNPYPKPGSLTNPQPFDGKYTRVEAGR